GPLASIPAQVAAQAFTPPQGVGGVTLLFQYYDDTGRRFTDGTRAATGQMETATVLLEASYGITDRFVVSLGLPYVFARYKDGPPPTPPYYPWDECHCWNSAFQDFRLAAGYRFGEGSWAVTPQVRYVQPSHDYEYRGQAVPGFNRQEFAVGLAAGWRLVGLLPRAVLEAAYFYSFVERFLDIPNDRSNGGIQIGYNATRRLFLYANGAYQFTHGGLRRGSPSGDPFYPPGEFIILDTPERRQETQRLFRNNFWQAGGGLSYSFDSFDVFASFVKYVWGTDTHDGQAYTIGVTWYFGGGK
ncbi:MAG TPA: hypothetical protein VL084_14385, partial [Thermoanaerobaculia bacterium]|nr:hypothetical protein [Thermoanaerobaculia bacterium]